MTTDANKPANTALPERSLDKPMRVKVLYFRTGVDLPTEQQLARMTSGQVRDDRPMYEVAYLPRVDKYLVRAYKPRAPNAKPDAPRGPVTHEFLIPGDWAVADLELP